MAGSTTTPTPTPTPTPTEEPKTIVTPVAPYSPDPNAAEGVDKNIARDGSGTHQVEPYGEDYPASAKIPPAAEQLNVRMAMCLGEPPVAQPAGEVSEEMKKIIESALETDKERLEKNKKFREAYIKMMEEKRDTAPDDTVPNNPSHSPAPTPAPTPTESGS